MTFTAGALADITLSSRMFRIKNALSMCSAPLECLISTLYWGLRAVDPRLVVPEELELDFLPGTDLDSWLHVILRPLDSNPSVSDDGNYPVTITDSATDVGFHMIPSALLVLDILFLSPPWTITPIPAIGLSAAIAFAYWFWIELCYQNNGLYVSLRPPSRSATKVILQKVSIPTLHNARHDAADWALLSQRSADGSCNRCAQMALWPRQRKGRNKDRVGKCEGGLSEMLVFLASGLERGDQRRFKEARFASEAVWRLLDSERTSHTPKTVLIWNC
jgi:hypothetical protein